MSSDGVSGAAQASGTASRSTTSWLIPSLAYVAIAGLLGVATKLALEGLNWQELIVWTAVVYVAIAGVLVLWGTRPRWGPGTGWASVSGGLAALALVMLFLALGTGEVSRVVPITSAYPVFTALLAAIVLSERVTVRRLTATVLVVLGVILLSVR